MSPQTTWAELSDDSLYEVDDGDGQTRVIRDHSPRLVALLAGVDVSSVNRTRLHNALTNAGIYEVADLLKRKSSDILKIKNCGRRSVADLQAAMGKHGLRFSDVPVSALPEVDGTRPIVYVQKLYTWINKRLDACTEIERETLTDVLLLLDGRKPTNTRTGAV